MVVILHTLFRPPGGLLERVPGFWAGRGAGAAGVKLTVEGLERIDPKQAYVVISNHQSAFDIFAHFAALPGSDPASWPSRSCSRSPSSERPCAGWGSWRSTGAPAGPPTRPSTGALPKTWP